MLKRKLNQVMSLGSPNYTMIDDRIFIGNANSVYDNKFLTTNNIKLIINASNVPTYSNGLNIPTVFIRDLEDSDAVNTTILLRKAKSMSELIHKYAGNGQSCLIHCYAGINRSAFMIAYYLITKRNYDPATAVSTLRHCNKINRNTHALTNPLFEKLLTDLGSMS